MIIVVIDYELEDYICENVLDGRTMDPITLKQFKKLLLAHYNDEIYFVNVSDKTWEKFRTKNSKRLELTLDELNDLLEKSSFLFLVRKYRVEVCTKWPKNE